MIRSILIAACCLIATNAGSFAQSKADAEKLARALKGDTKGEAADNPQCKLFTKSEASTYIGGVVHNVENAAMGTGCQWTVGSNGGSMLVQVVPARYHEKPSGASGYKKLPDVGAQAFVVPDMGGWHSGSLAGTHAVHVMLSGKGATEAKTVDLLKEAIKRGAASPAK